MTDFEKQVQILMEEHPDLFPTEAKFWAFLRGCLRRGIFEKSPMKIRAKNDSKIPPPEGYTGKGKIGHICALSGEWVMTSKAEVDHKIGHQSLSSESDIVPFITHLLASGEQLQVVDREMHKVKSYAERMGITFEEAKAEKKAIQIMKDLPVLEQQVILEKNDLSYKNAKERRAGLVELIKEGKL